MNRALIVGSAGQDGRILDTQLRARGVVVTGIDRGDVSLADREAVCVAVRACAPDAVYYLAAHHHSSEESADDDVVVLRESLDVHVHGLAHVLDALRETPARLFHAASSHVFGRPGVPLQNEATPRMAINVYGMTKSLGMDLVRHYRDAHGVHASSGILYNHESVLRGESFVTTRLVRGARQAAAARARGEILRIEVGSLSAVVDWGWAPDYTDAMQRIVQADTPDDYVVATGVAHSVGDFARIAFAAVGLDAGDHVVEQAGRVKKPSATLVGDASKLRGRLGWSPSVTFEDMVTRWVRGEFER